jgi:tripartite-type tricarboxylate transporter receptor subunit TctC
VLREPAFAKYLANEGAVPAPMTTAQFDAFLRQEHALLKEVVGAAKIRAD